MLVAVSVMVRVEAASWPREDDADVLLPVAFY